MIRNFFLASVFLFPAIASANDIPPIKAGLWSVTTKIDGEGAETIKQCTNQEVFEKVLSSGQKMMGGACDDLKIENTGGTYVSNLRCTIMGSKMVSHSEVKGDFDTSYTVTTKTTMTPAMMGMGNNTQVATAKYLGECEAGMEPGDTIMSDGKKMNALKVMDSMPNVGEMMKNMPDMGKMQQQLQQQLQGMN